MFRKKLNSTLLIFLHALIFTFPLMVKGVHYHSYGHGFVQNHEITVTSHEKPCFVCDYEFVTFDIETKGNNHSPLPAIKLFHSEIFSSDYKSSFYCFSHRGPPAC